MRSNSARNPAPARVLGYFACAAGRGTRRSGSARRENGVSAMRKRVRKSIRSKPVATPVNASQHAFMATVVVTPAAARQLDALNNPLHARVIRLLVRLEKWPDVSGVKRLTGELAGCY